MNRTYAGLCLLLLSLTVFADDNDISTEAADTVEKLPAADRQGDGIDSPKTMSGMSILGNEEAPKSLVIIPWQSSELGDDVDLSDSLDERANPVDKEVFLRELRYYEIRSGT